MKKHPINILATQMIDDIHLPWTFTSQEQEFQVIDYGRRRHIKEGYSIHARLSNGSVVELLLETHTAAWTVIHRSTQRKPA